MPLMFATVEQGGIGRPVGRFLAAFCRKNARVPEVGPQKFLYRVDAFRPQLMYEYAFGLMRWG